MDLIIPPAPPLANTVVDATDIGACIGERWLFSHLDLSFEAGGCTGIIGRNGLGKTTLLRMLMGLQEPNEGKVVIGKRTIFNYVDQQRLLLNPENSVMQEVAGLCDEIVVIAGGGVVAAGSADELRATSGAASLEDAFVHLVERA